MPFALRGDVKTVLAAACGAVAGLAAYFGTDYVWWLDAVLGTAVTLVVFILVPRRPDDTEIEVAAGVTLAQLNDAVQRTRGSGQKLLDIADEMPNAAMRANIAAIGRTLIAIAQCFEDDPADIRKAYDFLDYHLRRGCEMVTSYARLAVAPEMTPRERKRLDEFGAVIGELRTLFQEHLESIRSDDFDHIEQVSEAMRVIALKLERPRGAGPPLPAASTGTSR